MHKHHAFSSCGFIRPVLALALCAAPFAYSQTNQSSKFKSDNAVSHADTSFMKDAAQGGMAEVKLGTLAQQNAMSDRVKMFGKRMVDDHSKLNMQAQQVASQKNITLPTDVSSKQKSDYEMLSKKTGSDFDKAYISMMVKDHQTDIAEFQKEANSGSDADIKALAAKALPTLQEHLKMAQDIAHDLGVATK